VRPRLLQPTLPAAHATILRFGCFRLFSSFTSPTISTARVWPTPQLEWRATLGSTIACSAWESAFLPQLCGPANTGRDAGPTMERARDALRHDDCVRIADRAHRNCAHSRATLRRALFVRRGPKLVSSRP